LLPTRCGKSDPFPTVIMKGLYLDQIILCAVGNKLSINFNGKSVFDFNFYAMVDGKDGIVRDSDIIIGYVAMLGCPGASYDTGIVDINCVGLRACSLN